VGFKDLFENGRGRATFYWQDLEAGYSAPGQATARDLTRYGGTAGDAVYRPSGARARRWTRWSSRKVWRPKPES